MGDDAEETSIGYGEFLHGSIRKQVKVRGLLSPHRARRTAEPTAFRTIFEKGKRGLWKGRIYGR